jgi:hypothetical protein
VQFEQYRIRCENGVLRAIVRFDRLRNVDRQLNNWRDALSKVDERRFRCLVSFSTPEGDPLSLIWRHVYNTPPALEGSLVLGGFDFLSDPIGLQDSANCSLVVPPDIMRKKDRWVYQQVLNLAWAEMLLREHLVSLHYTRNKVHGTAHSDLAA